MREAPSAAARARSLGSRTACVLSCCGYRFHLSQPFIPFPGPGGSSRPKGSGRAEHDALGPGSLGVVLPWRGPGQAWAEPESAHGTTDSHRHADPMAATAQLARGPPDGE